MKYWDLEDKLICGTTDQGANIKKAMELYSERKGVSWIPCSSHKIQLCINKAIAETQSAKEIFDKSHKLSIFLRGGGVVTAAFNLAQTRLYGKAYKTLTTNVTRWNSHYTMAARLLQVIDAVSPTLTKLQGGSPDEKSKARELQKLMLSDS